MAAFERDVTLQNELGVPTRMIDVAEAEALSPLIETDGLLAAAYSPDDGHCTPESVVLGYATRRPHGTAPPCSPASPSPASTCTAAKPARCTPTAARSPPAPSSAPPGAWSRAIGEMVGTPLPVTPLRRQIVFTEPMPDLAEVVPFTIDFATTYYFHREGRGLLLGMSDPDQEPGFHLAYSDDWLPRLGAAIERPHPAAARRRPAATAGPGSTR